MFIFTLFAVLVWWGAYHWRRHALGFLVVVAGGGVLVLVAWVHSRVGEWTNGAIYVPVLQSILLPYIVLVVLVGLCFACAPHHTGGRLVRTTNRCRGCGYDLRGLPDSQRVCPECGVRFVGTPRRRCLHCDLDLTEHSASLRECPGCGRHPRIMHSPPPRVIRREEVRSGPVATFKPLSREPSGPEPVSGEPAESEPPAGGDAANGRSAPEQPEADPDQQDREG